MAKQQTDQPEASSTEQPKPGSTTLDSHLDKPQVTAPGDAPADTLDPNERASSATPDKGAAAKAGFGSVNAVVPLPAPERLAEPDAEERIETYQVVGPDGKVVTVEHDLNTGETRRK